MKTLDSPQFSGQHSLDPFTGERLVAVIVEGEGLQWRFVDHVADGVPVPVLRDGESFFSTPGGGGLVKRKADDARRISLHRRLNDIAKSRDPDWKEN